MIASKKLSTLRVAAKKSTDSSANFGYYTTWLASVLQKDCRSDGAVVGEDV